MDRQAKAKLRDEIKVRLQGSIATIVTEYRGLTCGEMTELRNELRKSDAEITVAKNRIVIKAIEDGLESSSALKKELKGPTALVTIKGDVANAAKTLLKFSSDHNFLVVKGGVMDGKALTQKDLKTVSELPTKEVLLSKIIGSLKSPHRGLVTVLSGVPRQVVQVINAIKDKKAGA